MAVIVTGAAGLIGSNLSSKLLNKGYKVIGIDNLVLGKKINLKDLKNKKNFKFRKLDLSNFKLTNSFFLELKKKYRIDTVWHLAANSDIKRGSEDFDIDFKDTLLTTYNLLKICKKNKIKNFFFASSSAIYGDSLNIKLKESAGPLLPISAYGSSKLASESFISSSEETFLNKAIIYRFPNVVGNPLTHGVIYDFKKKLIKNPKTLNVLGNGLQKKIYMHVYDLIEAMLFIEKKIKKGVHIFNIGPNDKGVIVKKIAKLMSNKFGINTKIIYQKKTKGWLGDIPSFNYDTNKLKRLGFKKKVQTSLQAISKCIKEI